jgi:hypothetical protein
MRYCVVGAAKRWAVREVYMAGGGSFEIDPIDTPELWARYIETHNRAIGDRSRILSVASQATSASELDALI